MQTSLGTTVMVWATGDEELGRQSTVYFGRYLWEHLLNQNTHEAHCMERSCSAHPFTYLSHFVHEYTG